MFSILRSGGVELQEYSFFGLARIRDVGFEEARLNDIKIAAFPEYTYQKHRDKELKS
jgi:hypothetical protein